MKNLKKSNWQDVSDAQVKDFYALSELSSIEPFKVAAFKNSMVYGVVGDGIDVRCHYADEVIAIYKKFVNIDDIYRELMILRWKDVSNDYIYRFEKDNERVEIECLNSDAAYITMSISDDKLIKDNILTHYFDNIDKNGVDVNGVSVKSAKEQVNELCSKLGVECDVMIEKLKDAGDVSDVYVLEKLKADNLDKMIKLHEKLTDKLYHIYFKKDLEKIKDKILNLDCEKTNQLMHHIGWWDEKECVLAYSKENVGDMVVSVNANGYYVKLEIEISHDYYIYGKIEWDVYHIYGLSDEREEWEDFLQIDKLAKEISENDEWLDYLNSL